MKILFIFVLSIISFFVRAEEVITLFPIERYNQKVNTWIKPSDPQYEKPVMSFEHQKKKSEEFYQYLMGELSPWNEGYVNKVIQAAPGVKSIQAAAIEKFKNKNKSQSEIGYGVNFHPYPESWILKIAQNMKLSQFSHLSYQSKNRGIALENLYGRLLPTDDVHFYYHKIAGQGYPFDNLQMSSIWVGTPIYILGESQDGEWLLILTSDFIVWVKSKGIGRVNDSFVYQWQMQGKKNLAAIIQTQTLLKDEKGKTLFTAYVGSVFPADNMGDKIKLMLPASGFGGNAIIKYSIVTKKSAAMMPLRATPKQFAYIMNTLIGRPYGWGNLYFYNDCSAELKNFFTPFGIWLPRDSSEQAKVGHVVDLSYLNKRQRLAYLLEKGRPFITLIYVGGHIALYLGKYPSLDTHYGLHMAMTYQNIWGLTSKSLLRKAVVGRSAFFPLLLEYPEDTNLISMLDKKIFHVVYIN